MTLIIENADDKILTIERQMRYVKLDEAILLHETFNAQNARFEWL